MKCKYGCNNDANFTTKQGKPICCKSPNQCPANRAKNSQGAKKTWKRERSSSNNLYMDSMRKKSIERKKADAKIRFDSGQSNHLSNSAIKRILIDHYNRGDNCELCGTKDWEGQPLTLELDHIDGDNFNNSLDNLRFICPNCHSQTTNFRGRNINTGRKKVTDEVLIDALRSEPNIRRALISVKMSPRGANYVRATKLLKEIVAEEGLEPSL
jgi:hypothetical protein